MKQVRLLPLIFLLLAGACTSSGELQRAPEPQIPASQPGVDAALTTPAPDAQLPQDPLVRTGMLENGLRYYIRHNTEPRNRSELRLVVDAGAVLEDDDQRGLAHFVEHMLFNGTERFPELELVNFFERIGMRFGPDLNAYTSFDETVYMLTIPTDSIDIVRRSFEVLEDWAGAATLSDEEIDKERGVIIEEWRMRDQNAQGRIRKKTIPVVLHGSRYEHRDPIGLPEIIRTATPETVRRFYRDWYRPDMMGVVVVGDMDVDRAEALIREHFGSLENPDDPRPRPSFNIPGHEETLYLAATDPEMPYTTITIYFKKDAEPMKTIGDYRKYIISQLFNATLNARFDELERSPSAPFLAAQVFRGGFARPAEFYGFFGHVHDDSVRSGLGALVTEAARVRTFGFTETELDRQKRELLRGYQKAYEEREKTNSASLADEYVSNMLEKEPIPGIEYEYRLVQQLLPTIDVGEVNALAAQLLDPANRAVIITAPEKEGVVPPSDEELAAVLRDVENRAITAYVDDVSGDELLPVTPPAAAITAERAVPEIGVTEITLENGVRVVMKPTDFKEDEVRFAAFSPGGTSLVAEDENFEAGLAPTLVVQSGAGPFSRTELEKQLAGQIVGVSPYISEFREGFRGSASPADLETLFQLIHLYATAPRADSSAMTMLQNQLRALLVNRSANPMAAFQDSLNAALFRNDPRRRPATVEMVDELSLETARRIYMERFRDASDFTFIFVGNFQVDSLKTLAQTYLGSLPAAATQESWRNVFHEPPPGVAEVAVRKGMGQQSAAAIVFNGPFRYDRLNRHRINALADVLDIRLREELREERGGVYNVSVSAAPTAQPDSMYTLYISFGADPEQVDGLVEAVFDEIKELQADGPSADDIDKVKEQQRRERETSLRTNNFWVSVLDFYYSNVNDDLLDVLRYNELIESLTADDIRDAARQYLNEERYVKVVLYPEE